MSHSIELPPCSSQIKFMNLPYWLLVLALWGRNGYPPQGRRWSSGSLGDCLFLLLLGPPRSSGGLLWIDLFTCLSLPNCFASKRKWKCDKGTLVSSSWCKRDEDMKLPQTFASLFQVITSLFWQREKHIFQVAFAIHVLMIFWEANIWRWVLPLALNRPKWQISLHIEISGE